MVPGNTWQDSHTRTGNIYSKVDLSIAWDFQQSISGLKIPGYMHAQVIPKSDVSRDAGGGRAILYQTNYGFKFWYVVWHLESCDGAGRRQGDSSEF